LHGPTETLAEFRAAGRALFSFGLVKEAEGNLSVYRDEVLLITRTGCRLDALDDGDVVSGGLDGELPGASSDLVAHRSLYAERGAGAVAHCHPAGTVPEEGGGPGAHGLYTFGPALDEAVARAVEIVRGAKAAR
jgi:ribulose-5-phosphate 4-epimerase/fuculose-1-phosphate aldolase